MQEKLNKLNVIDFIINVNDENFSVDKEDKKEDNKISELQIHKILYIVYGNFYAKFEKELFKDAHFEAWKYGPVEVDFRRYFNPNIKISESLKLKIHGKFDVELKIEEKDFLFKIIEKTLRFSPWSLVNFTHNTDPWLNNFDKDEMIIPNKEIQEWFKNVNDSLLKSN